MSTLAPTSTFHCGYCGRRAVVVVVNRKTGTVYDYACERCDEDALEQGPHIDYPLDTEARTTLANAAIDDYYGGM